MKFLWLCCFLLFTACTTVGGDPQSPFQVLNQKIADDNAKIRSLINQQLDEIRQKKVDLDEFTLQDIEQAAKIAQTDPVDPAGAMCWPVIATKLKERKQHHAPIPNAGIATFTEQMTKIIHPQGAPDERVQVACAAFAVRLVKDLVTLVKDGVALYSSFGASGMANAPKAIGIIKKTITLLHHMGAPIPNL